MTLSLSLYVYLVSRVSLGLSPNHGSSFSSSFFFEKCVVLGVVEFVHFLHPLIHASISLSLSMYVYLSHKLSDFNWEQMMRSRSVKVFNTDSSSNSTNLYTTVSTSVCTYIMCVCVCVCVCVSCVL